MKEEEIYTKLFNFSRPTFFKWKREKVPAIVLISKYFSKEDLNEFLEKGYVSKYEDFSNYALDPVFEDYVIINMKRLHRLNRSFFNLFFPTAEFITRHLKDFQNYSLDLSNLTIKNAKEKFKDFISSVKLHIIFDSETKRKHILEEIDENFADIEIFLLLKYPEKFL